MVSKIISSIFLASVVILVSCQKTTDDKNSDVYQDKIVITLEPIRIDTAALPLGIFASLEAEFNPIGSDLPDEVGFCWSRLPEPKIDDSKGDPEWQIREEERSLNFKGGFEVTTVIADALIPTSKYYARAYATSGDDVAYSEQISFTAPSYEKIFTEGGGVTDIDGNNYKTIIINGKEWMAENLRVSKLSDGTLLEEVKADSEWNFNSVDIKPQFSWMNYDEGNREKLGGYYNWDAVNTGLLCPVGWKVPSRFDLGDLLTDLGSHFFRGMYLRQAGLEFWEYSFLDDGRNQSGFGLRGAGYAGSQGFQQLDSIAVISSSTGVRNASSGSFWQLVVNYDNTGASISPDDRVANIFQGVNCRCVKN